MIVAGCFMKGLLYSDVQYTEKLLTLQYFFNTNIVSNLNIFIIDINIYRIVNILLQFSIY